MGKGKTKDPFKQMEKTYLKISWHHPVILDGRSKAKFSCYWSNQQNSQHKTFRATLSKHTHHFRGGHSVDEAGRHPPFQASALLSVFGLRRSGLSGSWPRTLFWSQTSSAVGSSRRRCISPSDIQRSSISDGYSAGLFIGTRPGPAARTKNLSPKPIVNKRPLCLLLFCWVAAENADLNESSPGTVLVKVTKSRNC